MNKTKKIAAIAVLSVLSATAGTFGLAGCNTDKHEHTFSDTWSTDAANHWYAATCEHEDEKKDYGAHVYTDDEDTTCNVCGYERTIETNPVVETGTVSGTVTAYGKPLSGVKVSVGSVDTVTSATGKYSLADVEIGDTVTVKFEKTGYVTKELTIAKADWTDKAATLDAAMNLSVETGTVSGTVKVDGSAVGLAGATVKLGNTVQTDEDGAYSFENVDVSKSTVLEIEVSHPACESYTDTVEITAGATAVLKDVTLTAKIIPVLNKTYFELADLNCATATDYIHSQNSEMWYVEHGGDGTRVISEHSEGLCLHVDSNATLDDMVPAIYQKFSITSANSNMMFRVRGFLGSDDKAGLLAVRVVDLEDFSVDDVNASNGEFWQTMDSNGFIEYHYDLSDYEGKDVVVIIGAKQGNHNAIERIRFIGADEEWVLPFVTAADLEKLTATEADNIEGIDAINNAFNDSSWNKVGGQSGANEGWLFMDADYADEGSTALRVFAYKKLTFSGLGTIVVRARTFTGQNSVSSGHDGQIYPQLVLKLIDADGNLVDINGNCATVSNGEGCEDFIFTLDSVISGDYTFVIGMARGQRLAVESIKYYGESVTGNITGTVKFNNEAVEGATVTCGHTTVTTAADGTFTIPATMLSDGSVAVKISKDGYGDKEFTVSAADLASGAKDLGEIVLVKAVLPGLSTEDFGRVTTQTAVKFESPNGDIKIGETWSKYGDVDFGHGEGACIQRNSSTPVSYLYAKFTIDDEHSYMKFNARMFVRDSDQPGWLQVKVIEEDGTVAVITPMCVARSMQNITATNLNGSTLINDNDNYTEGVYDLSSYKGKTVIIVIQDVNDNVTKDVHNAINEIAFRSNSFYVAGNITGTVKTDGANVSVNGNNVALTDGQFSYAALLNTDGSVTVTVTAAGYATATYTVNASDFANGTYSLGDITLAAATMEGIIEAKEASLTAINLNDRHSFGSTSSGGADGWENSGYNEANNDICIPFGGFVYAKVSITDSYKFMKFNARGKDGVGGKMIVRVYADGAWITIAPSRVYGTTDTAIDGNYLLNNRGDNYNEGVYDFSAYVGKDIIIAIQTAECLDGQTTAYTKCNEIAFFGTVECDKGDSGNYYAVPQD